MPTIKQITDPDYIDDACHLLYKVYIEQGNWQFSPNNPSELRVETRNNRSLLVDRFTHNAVWFGAFDNDEIIGCTRLVLPDKNNKLEIEGYESSEPIQKYLPDNKRFCVELSKAAILKRPGRVRVRIHDIFLVAFRYCQRQGYSVLVTPVNNAIRHLLDEIGAPLKQKNAFKYEQHDPEFVSIYFADYTKFEVKLIIESLEDKSSFSLSDVSEVY